MTRLQSLVMSIGIGLVAACGARAQSTTNCDAATTNLEIRQCLNREAAKADTALTEVADSIAQSIDSAAATQLLQAQTAWTRYRKLQCAAVAAVYGEGTMAPVATLQCMLALTEQRLQFLRDVYPAEN